MTATHKQLLFDDVDGLAFAAARKDLDKANPQATYEPRQLGPLLELLHLSAGGRMPRPGSWLLLKGIAPLVAALEQKKESWVSLADAQVGFIRAARSGPDGDSRLTSFLMRAKRAGRDISGLPATVSGQLVAAMEELENNIHEHAEAPETGVIAYKAEAGRLRVRRRRSRHRHSAQPAPLRGVRRVARRWKGPTSGPDGRGFASRSEQPARLRFSADIYRARQSTRRAQIPLGRSRRHDEWHRPGVHDGEDLAEGPYRWVFCQREMSRKSAMTYRRPRKASRLGNHIGGHRTQGLRFGVRIVARLFARVTLTLKF